MENYDRKLEEIKAALIYAYQNWEIWWFIKTEKYNHKNVYNKYLVFFTNSEHAHWVTTIMAIGCLIDYKNISVIKFYKELCGDKKLSAETIKDVDNRFKGVEQIMKGIRQIRHNIVAHISEKEDAEAVFARANLKETDLRDAIVELGNILNIINVSMGGNPLGFWLKMRADQPEVIIEKNDTERIFIDLKKRNKFICRLFH